MTALSAGYLCGERMLIVRRVGQTNKNAATLEKRQNKDEQRIQRIKVLPRAC